MLIFIAPPPENAQKMKFKKYLVKNLKFKKISEDVAFFIRLGQILVQIDALAQENTIPVVVQIFILSNLAYYSWFGGASILADFTVFALNFMVFIDFTDFSNVSIFY